jgi:hypothetical protein
MAEHDSIKSEIDPIDYSRSRAGLRHDQQQLLTDKQWCVSYRRPAMAVGPLSQRYNN